MQVVQVYQESYIEDSVEPFPALKVLKCTSSCGLSFIFLKRLEIGCGVLASRYPLAVSSGAIFLCVCLCLSSYLSPYLFLSVIFRLSPFTLVSLEEQKRMRLHVRFLVSFSFS